MSAAGSYFLEDRSQPLVNNNAVALNDQFITQYVDVAEDDYSCHAQMVRSMANFVGTVLLPRQVLAILRILKAMSLSFIVLTILANAMYIIFVEVFASKEVQEIAGGWRDTLIRLFGLMLSLVALAIEVDYAEVVKLYMGLKAFIPRALLYLFISLITSSHPMSNDETNQKNNYNANGNNGDDDANQYDDAYQQQDDMYYESTIPEIPSSAVAFQMVTSLVLGCCGLGYLFCGILCFDRFTALAFISTKDPRVTTAIPSTMESGNAPHQDQQSGLSEGLYA